MFKCIWFPVNSNVIENTIKSYLATQFYFSDELETDEWYMIYKSLVGLK